MRDVAPARTKGDGHDADLPRMLIEVAPPTCAYRKVSGGGTQYSSNALRVPAFRRLDPKTDRLGYTSRGGPRSTSGQAAATVEPARAGQLSFVAGASMANPDAPRFEPTDEESGYPLERDFPKDEYELRVRRARAYMAAEGLDALIITSSA